MIILQAVSHLSFRDTIAGGQDSVALPILPDQSRPCSSPFRQSSSVGESDSRSK